MTRSAGYAWLALLLALAPRAGAGDVGVIGELQFLDGGAGPDQLYDGHIRLDLSPRPKRRPFPMLLDTGAQQTMMTPKWARALRVNVRRIKDDYYRKKTSLGRDVLFRVDTGWSETMQRRGVEIGLLGGDFLRDYVVEVDYRAGRVRFLDPAIHAVSEETAEPDEIVLPMGMTDGRPTVRIGLGSGELSFLMDTGAPGSLLVSEEKARALGIAISEEATQVLGRNMYGESMHASFYVPAVRLGEHIERHVTLGVALREGAVYRVTNVAGRDEALLGNRFLSRFRVRFDYPHQRVALLPQIAPGPLDEVIAHLPPEALAFDAEPSLQPVSVPVDLSPARPARSFEQTVWIELEPDTSAHDYVSLIPYYDLRGLAGAGQPVEHDVMIVVDTSGSTAVASGSDVDGDGKLGRRSKRRREPWRSFNPAYLSNDAGDTVLAAELLATRRLIERLGPGRTRIGIATFSSVSRLEAPLGTDEAKLQEKLDDLDSAFGSGGTNMAHALRIATEALVIARPSDEERRQSILILSDGYPTTPKGSAADEAYDAAREAAELGIRIYSFALGLGELEADDVYVEMALVSGGGHVRLEQPGEVVHELALINLTDVTRIEIRNMTSGSRARATRVFPDGSFDSLVPLVRGENTIEVTARGEGGGEMTVERRVVHTPPEPADEAEARRYEEELEAFRDKLRTRTLETALGGRRERAIQAERELEVTLEGEASGPATD